MAPALTRDGILGRSDKRTETIDVPEWGGSVTIGTMGPLDYADLSDWQADLCRRRQTEKISAAATTEPMEEVDAYPADFCCDSPLPDETAEQPPADEPTDLGFQPLYRDLVELRLRWAINCIVDPETHRRIFTLDDLPALGEKDPQGLERIVEAAQKLNLQTVAASEAFAKNSDGTPAVGSGGA